MRIKGFIAVIPLFMMIFLSGCVSTTDPKISFAPPKYVEEMPSQEEKQIFGNLGSLYGQGDNPLFADRRAMKVNDLVTVVIQESATASSSAEVSRSKSTEMGLNGPALIDNNAQNSKFMNNLVSGVNRATNLGVGMSSSNTFDGSGSNDRSDTFTTTISARIIKVLQNGNYFIEGSRELLINNEKQTIRVSGIIRPYDIDKTNTIDSKYIADAKILYETQGNIARQTEQGWATKVIESVWPF